MFWDDWDCSWKQQALSTNKFTIFNRQTYQNSHATTADTDQQTSNEINKKIGRQALERFFFVYCVFKFVRCKILCRNYCGIMQMFDFNNAEGLKCVFVLFFYTYFYQKKNCLSYSLKMLEGHQMKLTSHLCEVQKLNQLLNVFITATWWDVQYAKHCFISYQLWIPHNYL